MDAQAAARLGDEIAHGFGVAAMVAGAVAGALIGAAVVAATAATGGLAAVILAGSIAAGGLSMFQIVKGLTTIFELPEPTTGVLIRGSFNVYVNSRNAMRAGDDVSATCSGLPLNHPLWPFPVLIAEGSATVYINGKPAARLQSKMVCGAHIKTGSQNTFIGGPTERVAFVLDLEEWLHTGLEALGLAALAGGLLLAAVCYAGFKVEHVRGHHVHVSTPEDASSSRYGQSLYSFLPHAYKHNFLNAWRLESERLKRKGLPALHWRNELIWWYAISALFLLGFSLAFGWLGAIFFLGQSVMAFTLLEIVNYVEHYGLHRRRLDNGRYERTTPEHSWNSNFLLTNLFLFHLQRHSDHHAYAKRRYQVLRHYDSSPQLPNGYAGMIVLALFPPLWRAVMDPKVRAYYAGEEYQLTDTQRI